MKYRSISMILLLSSIVGPNAHAKKNLGACAEFSGMKIGEGGLAISAGTLYTLGEIAEKGFNIRRIRFAGKLSDIKEGNMPKAEIAGTIFGQDFHFKLNLTQEDLTNPGEFLGKFAEKVTELDEAGQLNEAAKDVSSTELIEQKLTEKNK